MQLPAPFAFAAARAAAMVVCDALPFWRWTSLAVAVRALVRPAIAQAFAGLLGGAAIALVRGVTPRRGPGGGVGLVFAALWMRDRGAWGAIGAHAVWLLLLGSVLHGGLLNLDWSNGDLVTGAHASGAPAWLAAIVPVVAGLAVPRLLGGRTAQSNAG